jgi:N-acetylmuramoyl-L-alanine amidase
MIVFALGLLQLAASGPWLVVRDANHSIRVPIVATANGPMLRPESLSEMLPISVHHDSGSSYTVDVWGTRLQLESGVAIVRVAGESRPLAAAPTVTNGHLMVPLQLVSEVFPTVVANTRWDPETGQLVLFTASTAGTYDNSRAPLARPRQRVAESSTASRSPESVASTPDSRLPPVPVKHHRFTVIVDAGHGGVDNGMTGPIGAGPRIYEKDITLLVANKLGEQLKLRGVDVVYTRTSDTLIALDDRGRIANRASGDLFISIHVNAANPTWKDPAVTRGYETYFLSEARTEDARRVEQMENESVRYEDASRAAKADPLSFIVNDMYQNQHLRESSELADLIQQRLGRIHPGPSRGVKQAGFRVLVTAYMPAVLVEIGFGTNAREAAYLSLRDNQAAIATAVADAAMAYLHRYEGRVATAGAGRSNSKTRVPPR